MPNKITLQDIYTINQQIYERMDKIDERVERMECRTSNLEIWRSELIGRAAVTVFFLNMLVVLAVEWVKNEFFK